MRGLTKRRIIFLVGALLLLGGAIAQVAAERRPTGPPLSSVDPGPTGSLALAEWLQTLGYGVERVDGSGGPGGTEVLFILEPLRRFQRAEAQSILDWVRRGGVLVYAPARTSFAPTGPPTVGGDDGLAELLEVSAHFTPYMEQADPVFPIFVAPPAQGFLVRANRSLELRSDDWVPLVQNGDRVLAAGRQLGDGWVYASASEMLFSNLGIAAQDNEAFVLNILARHPGRRAAAFEEYHHTVLERPDLADTIRTSPWGWSLMYAALVGGIFLVWGGRRFGPALVEERAMARSGGDYVVAFAGLLQKARAAGWVQEQYAGLVRRRLARELAVRADLSVEDLARLLGERRNVDMPALTEQLRALEGPPLGQRALLHTVRSVEQMLRQDRWGLGKPGREAPSAGG